MKKIALIVAAGSGSRMGAFKPKQFLELQGKTVIWHTIKAFEVAYPNIEIVLVLNEAWLMEGINIQADFPNLKIQLAIGGETRFHSVQNGLKHVDEAAIVFVHDAARCLITPQLIKNCANVAEKLGSAIPIIPVTDSIRTITESGESVAANREMLKIVQTPQTFQAKILIEAYKCSYKTNFTDEASVVEAAGKSVHLCEGDIENIKITTPLDLAIAAILLEKKSGL
jgi:2-C-methyl-D-erythritol 4-phosphate cytidylyltransferase